MTIKHKAVQQAAEAKEMTSLGNQDEFSNSDKPNSKNTSENNQKETSDKHLYPSILLNHDPDHASEQTNLEEDNMTASARNETNSKDKILRQNVDDYDAEAKNLTFHNITNSFKPNFNNMGKATFYELSSFGNVIKKKLQMENSDTNEGTNKNASIKDKFDEKVVKLSEKIDENENVKELSSDLIDTLIAGCPAALFSMTQMLYDDRNVQRASLLLNILSVHVNPLNQGEHFQNGKFKIDLEYGVGPNRLKWSVYKNYKDLLNLHLKFKAIGLQEFLENKIHGMPKTHKLLIPKFPRNFNKHDANKKNRRFLNGVPFKTQSTGNLSPELSRNDSFHSSLTSINSNVTTNVSEVFIPQRQNIFFKHLKIFNHDNNDDPLTDDPNIPLNERLEKYLKILNLALSLRPVANKLFQFYEISPISNLLSYETGYIGKQGYLIMASSAKANGWRVSHFRFQDWKAMVQRHTHKWFLVRHSYITFVNDLHSTTPLDVFLVDSKFLIKCSFDFDDMDNSEYLNNKKLSAKGRIEKQTLPNKFQLELQNGERNMKLLFKSESSMKEWLISISKMISSTIWSGRNRFDSFAPVRYNAFCKFLVDGRDYFWALSEALLMAQDCIFIHDWWLSPELYMRKPIEGNQQYRLDRILRDRASNGVKIFIIVYRNVGTTVGTDSSWTKHTLLNLHPNIHVIRSPNQWLQTTFFWAHHEKLVMIDHSIAFIGGIDLCYGRYDTPEHALTDFNPDFTKQIFPGKDYSNARVCDFYELEKPFETMYDRNTVPRMPWHDVHMMTIGEVARDLSRHFVQRWNYLLRQKRPSRPTPLLTPPSDFTKNELETSPLFKLIKDKSTCECQLLRSSGDWSLGLKETEKSIQNAYLKLIETSEHYMYIENQFFVTSSEEDGILIENSIGDAIVDRVIKANQDNQKWKAFIIIPLMPGFPSEVDKPEGSALRLIIQCQYMSISRGETSIFGKLKKVGIDPLDYIQFFSLRKWSEIGPNKRLITEQLYVHAKVMIVDDRSCIIGSANINERSMAGNHDSEIAILVRDTDLVKTKMDGKEYLAGRFALELRQRLMREHMGCDVDLIEYVERKFQKFQTYASQNFKTLHTLKEPKSFNSSPLKTFNSSEKDQYIEYCISSAEIELALRDVLDINYSPKWKQIHGELRNFGIFMDNETFVKENEESTIKQPFEKNDNINENGDIEFNEKKELPSSSNFYQSIYHTFNNRAGEANLGIKDDKPVSSDPRVKPGQISASTTFDKFDPEHFESSSNKKDEYLKDVGEQLLKWGFENFMEQKSKNSKKFKYKNPTIIDILPTKDKILKFIYTENIDNISKWDLLKRISYLQHLAAKKDKLNNNINSSIKNKESFDNHEKHSKILGTTELTDDDIDQMLSFISLPKQLNTKLKKIFEKFDIDHEDVDNDYISHDNLDNISDYSNHSNVSVSDIFINTSYIDPYSFSDPLIDSFYQDLWFSIAMRNSYIYRLVFHCQPDNSVNTWSDYKKFNDLFKEFNELQQEIEDIEVNTAEMEDNGSHGHKHPPSSDLPGHNKFNNHEQEEDYEDNNTDFDRHSHSYSHCSNKTKSSIENQQHSFRMKLARGNLNRFENKVFDKYSAKKLLQRIHGHLVIFPYNWLDKEVENNNWYYNADRIAPIEIYN